MQNILCLRTRGSATDLLSTAIFLAPVDGEADQVSVVVPLVQCSSRKDRSVQSRLVRLHTAAYLLFLVLSGSASGILVAVTVASLRMEYIRDATCSGSAHRTYPAYAPHR